MKNIFYIPIGFQCAVPEVLQSMGLKRETLPFDWMLSNPKFVYTILDLLLVGNVDIEYLVNEHFFNCENKVQFQSNENFIELKNGDDFYNKRYEVIFPHDKNFEKDVEKYCRRFDRLKNILYNKEITPVLLYISPSSNLHGNFTINGEIIIKDSIKYFNKIFELVSKIRNDFEFIIIDATNIEDVHLLNENIKYEKIDSKNYYTEIKGDCINILNKYK